LRWRFNQFEFIRKDAIIGSVQCDPFRVGTTISLKRGIYGRNEQNCAQGQDAEEASAVRGKVTEGSQASQEAPLVNGRDEWQDVQSACR
jgi:hypothetical protein